MNNEQFFKNLRNFIVDIISTNFNKENKSAKIVLADSAIKNHFGVNLRKLQDMDSEPSTSQKRKSTAVISSDEQDVLSTGEVEDEQMWETVEKKIVKTTAPKGNKKAKKGEQKSNKGGGKRK